MTTEQAAPSTAAPSEVLAVQMIVGGEHVDAADGQTFEVGNPATGRTIATAPLGGRADIERYSVQRSAILITMRQFTHCNHTGVGEIRPS